MKLLLVGYGKMGRLVEELAPAHGCEIVGPHRRRHAATGGAGRRGDRLLDRRRAARRTSRATSSASCRSVIGTTGWSAHEAELRRAGRARRARRRRGGELFDRREPVPAHRGRGRAADAARTTQYGAWIHEAHHATKRDAPSGTALLLRDAMVGRRLTAGRSTCRRRGPARFPAFTRSDSTAASDTIELTHTARDRRGFAAGALVAAQVDPRTARLVHDAGRAADVMNTTHDGTMLDDHLTNSCRRASWLDCVSASCELHSPASAPRSSRRSGRTARSTRPPCGGWRGGRSTPASTSSRRAARPARRRR